MNQFESLQVSYLFFVIHLGFKRCCINSGNGQENDGKIFVFNLETLSEFLETLIIRKDHNLKHSDFEIPSICDDVTGFHMDCYRRFIALSKEHGP